MKFVAFAVVVLGALVWAGCGPYTPAEDGDEADSDRDRFGIAAALDPCASSVAGGTTPSADELTPAGDESTPVVDPSTAAGSETTTPASCVSPSPEATVGASPSDTTTPVPAVTRATSPTLEPTIYLTPTPLTATHTPTPMEPGYEETMAVYTATARASRSLAYLSFGDGIQWGCCGFLSQSSAALFGDYLQTRSGRPVIWQTSGSGYDTTDTYLYGSNGDQPQTDFSIELIRYYQRERIPIAAITMSIGGNNLVELGNNCPDPPCIDAFIAGAAHLREQLHLIYSRISAAKDVDTPLMVLLYYDANQCTNPDSGAAVDAWNAVIAEVATQYGAFLVDARAAFRGHCDWFDANGLDANAAGHAAIAAEYQRVYDALPAQYHAGP